MSPQAKKTLNAVVEYGWPAGFLIVFLLTKDLVQATWGLVAGAAIALVVGYVFERRIAPMPLIAGLIALVTGALTLIFHDPRFIQIKPTVTSVAFGLILLGGLAMGKNPLKYLLAAAIQMPDEGWRKLTRNYGVFFLAVAALNEVVWRTQSEATWAWFRFPGLSVIHVLFAITQAPLMMKYAKTKQPEIPPVPPVE
jgi:intracellular septation protein